MATTQKRQPPDAPGPEFRLVVRGHARSGYLQLSEVIRVPVEKRHIRLLLAMNDALRTDKDVREEADRGWVRHAQIAELWPENDLDYTPDIKSLRCYKSQICGRVRAAASAHPGRCVPQVFLQSRAGFRLARGLSVLDLSRRRPRRKRRPPAPPAQTIRKPSRQSNAAAKNRHACAHKPPPETGRAEHAPTSASRSA